MEVSIQDEINQIQMEKPHVVILGAGASCAAFPNGDRNGRKLPSMNNFIDVLELDGLLSNSGLNFPSDNFEEIYNLLCKDVKSKDIRFKLEEVIYQYFKQLVISDKPTIYDHLVLSLRPKDIIATFNWDPFLIQAFRRNSPYFKLPRLLFLHGNVEVGCCERDKISGIIGNICSCCGEVLKPTKLLYPIGEKNYHEDGFISSQWKELHDRLKDTFMITIFGYGAPKSDQSAIDLMKLAWGNVAQRNMEETEIIDIRTEKDLYNTWKPFIHSHHFETLKCFYESWIANHPRRTGEAYINQYHYSKIIDNNPIPQDISLSELWNWFKPLQEIEIQKERQKKA